MGVAGRAWRHSLDFETQRLGAGMEKKFMSKGIVESVVGYVEISAGFAVGIATFGGAAMLSEFLIGAGAGMVMQPIGSMLDPKEPRQCQSI